MLATSKQTMFRELVSGASYEELIWMNGFLAGIMSGTGAIPSAGQTLPEGGSATPEKITILYGTETGNSKQLATKLAGSAKQQGIAVKLSGLDQYKPAALTKETHVFLVISTQGDGELPAAAVKFYNSLKASSPDLSRVRYSVLALGDSSYPLFCKAGEDMEALFSQKGAQCFFPIQKCDTDYEEDAQQWFRSAIQSISSSSTGPAPATKKTSATRKTTYSGVVLSNILLNDRGSSKETYHIELEADNVVYEPGDSIGIIPENPSAEALEICRITDTDPEKKVVYRDETHSVFHLLHKKLQILFLPERIIRKYGELVRQEIPETRMALTDLLRIYPLKEDTQLSDVLALLEPVAPRLYSISSSPSAHEGEIHITVARDSFLVNNELHYGLCSNYLSGLEHLSALPFYVHPNRQFRLPGHDRDVIMIGPGTGIAPFRSFLAERDAAMASGKNWLFFGEREFTTDFLYQTELQSWFETGLLTRINTAFSRDQQEKIYVQHRMSEHARELFEWLEQGAYIYVCGARDPMSRDVEQTLLQIISAEGQLNGADAETYLGRLAEEGRYLKDVY